MNIMLIVYEVVLSEGADADGLLSSEVLEETHAQVMTLEQARAVGISHGEVHAQGLEVRLIAVAPHDARYVLSRLESSHVVQSFRAHEVP